MLHPPATASQREALLLRSAPFLQDSWAPGKMLVSSEAPLPGSDGISVAGRARAQMEHISPSRFHPALLTQQLLPTPPPALSSALLQVRNSSYLAICPLYW